MKQSLTTIVAITTFAASIAVANPARAADGAGEATATAEDGWELGFGARIGGYGFREVRDESVTWEDCRMDGIGVFMTVDFTDHIFGEAGFDLYHATGPTVAAGMDRISFHNQYAAGVRVFPEFFLTPYIQVGGGPEITTIEMNGAEKTEVVPSGFMGIGGELNIGSIKLGMNIRMLMMTHPVHDHGADGTYHHALEPDGEAGATSEEVQTDWEVAGQAQFFARFAF